MECHPDREAGRVFLGDQETRIFALKENVSVSRKNLLRRFKAIVVGCRPLSLLSLAGGPQQV